MPYPFLDSPVSPNPAVGVAAVTPSDTTDMRPARALWIGGAGSLVIVAADGSSATIAGIPAGSLLPIAAKRVNATGTTATAIVALY